MPRPFLFRLMLGAAVFGATTLRAEDAPETAIWEMVSNYLSKEAAIDLKKLPPPGNVSAQRERDFCAAVVLLDQQPLTESRLDEVELRLEKIRRADVPDEIGSASRYLLGRIAQLYRASPDVNRAAETYRELIAHPGAGHWADIGRVKLAVLILYALPAGSLGERISSAEALLAGATDPIAVRDLHRVVGRAIMFYNFPPSDALRHLLAADRIGGVTGTLGADQLVQIGELAWDTGDDAMAKKYYDRLRRDYPRDPRIFLMDQRLAGKPVPHRGKEYHGR